jgi:hypothetical protein
MRVKSRATFTVHGFRFVLIFCFNRDYEASLISGFLLSFRFADVNLRLD